MGMAVPAEHRGHKQPPALRLLKGRKPGVDAQGNEVVTPPFERGEPVKPDDLSIDAAFAWDLIVEQWKSLPGQLKPLDALALAVACETYARWKEAVRWRQAKQILAPSTSGGIVVGPWVTVEERASRDWRAWCAEFGLTPAAESNLPGVGDASGEANPFE